MASYDTLLQIQRADPDGGEREPTEADYAAFEAWVIRTYGRAAWDHYRGNTGWGEALGPDYFDHDDDI